MAMLSAVVVAALAGYLLHNFHPASIFMGDTGSLIIGFLLAIQAIQFVGLNESVAFTTVFGLISSVMPVAILMILFVFSSYVPNVEIHLLIQVVITLITF